MMSLRWGVLHKKTSWTFRGEANGNKWHNCRWLIPPIANSAACARARPCRPGRAGVSVAGPGYCQTVPVSVAREVQLKNRKMPFSDWAIRLYQLRYCGSLRLQGFKTGRELLMGCQFCCKTLRLEADGSIWHHSKRQILPNRAYGSRTRPGPAVLKNLGPGPPGLARDSDPETPA